MEKRIWYPELEDLIVYFRTFSKTCTAPGTFTQFLYKRTIPNLPCGKQFIYSQNLYFVSVIQTCNFHIISISVLCRGSCINTLLRICRPVLCDHWVHILSSCFQKYHNNFLMKYRNDIEIRNLRRNYIIKMSVMTYLLEKEYKSLFSQTYHCISLVASFPRSNWIIRKICCIHRKITFVGKFPQQDLF